MQIVKSYHLIKDYVGRLLRKFLLSLEITARIYLIVISNTIQQSLKIENSMEKTHKLITIQILEKNVSLKQKNDTNY